ncbi:hypothetical protein LRD69_00705 [Streptomyces sp. JH14]|uniref:hypothetical protein n=1 Tax=Streptomyces sp. JH14 TaxID=2793630 RepID=UPI0023F72826|nr:hypothetical protein [Streptomyces sp. JH14]MDF6040710.1 hypothetical protein [Streptomyces sp. JH14]
MSDQPRTAVAPVAFRDPSLLDAVGVHEPFALRAIVETATGMGITGPAEAYAGRGHPFRLARAARAVIRPGELALPVDAVRVPRAPGPGTARDRDAVARLQSRTRSAHRTAGTTPAPCNGSTPITVSARRTGRRRPPRKEFSWHGSTG